MPEPVYFKRSLLVAAIALLQTLLPAVLIVAVLYLLAAALDVAFNEFFVALALLAGVLALLMLRVESNGIPMHLMRPRHVGAQLILRWLALLAILLATGYITGFSTEYSRRVVLSWAAITPVLLLLATFSLHTLLRRVLLSHENVRSAVIAGFNPPSRALAEKLVAHPELCLRVEGFFDDRGAERLGELQDFKLLGRLSEIADYVRTHRVDVIFVALPMRHVKRVMDMLDDLRDSTASIYYVPDLFVFDLIQSRTAQIMGIPVVSMRETPFYGFHGVKKRITDVAFTLGILMFALPLMALIALAIRLTSKGPVIFRQRRYGLDGREITVYKFRSMYVTEDGQNIVQATPNDPRVTPVGRFLRRYSLDELPQLINVLQGRMSLVGPRPHAVAHNEEYRRLIKGYMVRHKALPGITGLAQVNGCRGETRTLAEMEKRVAYDLEYLRNWTPWLDLKILVLTVVRVFNDRHAY